MKGEQRRDAHRRCGIYLNTYVNTFMLQSGLLPKFVSRFVLPVMCLHICSLQIYVRILYHRISCGHRVGRTARQSGQLHHGAGVCNTLPQCEAADPRDHGPRTKALKYEARITVK